MCRDCDRLDSWDMAFLTLTGHVRWIPLPEKMAMAAKASGGHGSKEYLWGPEADLMAKAVIEAWNSVAKKKVAGIANAFDLSGDISVDMERLEKQLKQTKKIGKAMWLKAGAKIRAILDATVERAKAHFMAQKKAAMKLEWEEYVAAANADHIRAFMEEWPERVLHPEVIRLATLAQERPDSRIIDRAQLSQRISMVADRGEEYFETVSDVQVGRAWTMTGLEMAVREEVTEYMVVAEMDDKTCPVCLRLHGRTFAVEPSYKKMEAVLGENDADAISKTMPFPRVSQIDNKSPQQIRDLGLFPPFHGRCRCDIIFLWR